MNVAPAPGTISNTVLDASAPAIPLVFDGMAGFFHAADGDTAVLLLSPWGYEELCTHKSIRLLAERLADAGFPCLRYNYPATGHSLGVSAELDDETAWRRSARHALEELRSLAAPSRIIVIGQGIGGALAGDLARDTDLDGLVLMAPVIQGRAYLRELAAWTAMTKPSFLVSASDGPEDGVMAGGFVLSAATTREVRSLNLTQDWTPCAEKVLLVAREDHGGDAMLAEILEDRGIRPDTIPFERYADYVSDSVFSIVIDDIIEKVVAWCSVNFPLARVMPRRNRDLPAVLSDQDFRETLLRFGPDRDLFGVFTEPTRAPSGTAYLFLNTGLDHAIGWGRMVVDFARTLAREGHASFRIDVTGIGETRLRPGQAPEVMYTDTHIDDVERAIDWLFDGHGIERVVLVGRCSGSYLAGISAVADERVSGVAIINARRLVWDTRADFEKEFGRPVRALETYKRRLSDRKAIQKVLSGQVSIPRLAMRLADGAYREVDRALAPIFGRLTWHGQLGHTLNTRFATLRDRGTAVELIYANEDAGPRDLEMWFGEAFEGLGKYPNIRLSFISHADHNLTPIDAREAVLEKLRNLARRVCNQGRPVPISHRHRH